jgi:hypothetical protein
MGLRKVAQSIGIVILSLQILFLSTGIHDSESHSPQSHSGRMQAGADITKNLSLSTLSPDSCNACFANRILRQCLFPAAVKPTIVEYFRPCIPFIRKMAAFPAPSPEINRGPPSASSLLS